MSTEVADVAPSLELGRQTYVKSQGVNIIGFEGCVMSPWQLLIFADAIQKQPCTMSKWMSVAVF